MQILHPFLFNLHKSGGFVTIMIVSVMDRELVILCDNPQSIVNFIWNLCGNIFGKNRSVLAICAYDYIYWKFHTTVLQNI